MTNAVNEMMPETVVKGITVKQFAKLVYGELPLGDDIVNTLKIIKERLDSVEWTIKINYRL